MHLLSPMSIRVLLVWAAAGTLIAVAPVQAGPPQAGPPQAAWFRMQSPGPESHEVEQASDLCFGSVADREGLWTVCDRNGGRSAGRIYLFSPSALDRAKSGEAVVAAEEFVMVPPRTGWPAFRTTHAMLAGEVLDHIQARLESGLAGNDGQRLDLEAVAIAPGIGQAESVHLFVAAEEPYSVVLELAIERRTSSGASGGPRPSQAHLVAAYRYAELESEHGLDFNDGLEGLAYTSSPGLFWWAEEGTRLNKPDAHPRLFFADPRLGRARLQAGAVKVERGASEAATRAVRELRSGDSQTLNALAPGADGVLLAVDRNGGWILRADPGSMSATRWFNVYDAGGLNLREALASFPAPRRMPYISIEGIAVDATGDLWLVDDPAMPEPFRASCLIRLRNLPAPPKSAQPAAPDGRSAPAATRAG